MTIGRSLADLPAGRPLFLIGFRNRIFVFLDWIVAYVSFERGARLVIGGEN